ncbi:hypothetical protein A6P39_034420 [Streptomyces sp. FXJ1.172]|uniref:hypothetical protein n=1 Tax=Streptomyces sp. FXJ1.172 TaxID=710705 RepID=UPI000A509BCB|nr:hypothetical protein [Streptomyces sp. FXJ1.172]WEO98729.1 hypothetical protein A6P39_034420 [Streptomyces sp. FXJ1.172]
MFDEAGEDGLLLTAMMQLGAKGGSIGAAAGGAATGVHGLGRAGARGGARGAARGFKWTKKDVSTTVVELSGAVMAVSQLVHNTLADAGNLIGAEARDDGGIAVRAMVGVGMGGLNPTVVTAVVAAGPEGVAVVELRAAGREGLIKRHPADNALAKITSHLKAASR